MKSKIKKEVLDLIVKDFPIIYGSWEDWKKDSPNMSSWNADTEKAVDLVIEKLWGRIEAMEERVQECSNESVEKNNKINNFVGDVKIAMSKKYGVSFGHSINNIINTKFRGFFG